MLGESVNGYTCT